MHICTKDISESTHYSFNGKPVGVSWKLATKLV